MHKVRYPLLTVWFALACVFTIATGQDNKTVDASPDVTTKPSYAIAIHGGAGKNPRTFSKESIEARRDSLRKALQIGVDILKNGGAALQAVEKVVLVLEDDPLFNAGVGAVYNSAGGHELDASIMDGRTLACGAVAGVTRVKNPITLARLVMDETPHVLLAGPGAEAFAEKMNVQLVEPSYFDTDYRFKQFQRLKAKKKNQSSMRGNAGGYYGTVGCVALDSNGNLAAATSTGGTPNKRFGRIGDSPIIGAGTYADNRACAVSCTGQGEEYIRNAIAYDVAAQMKYRGSTLTTSVGEVIQKRLKKGDGGIIAVDRMGAISMDYNTESMARGAADANGRFEVFWGENLDLTKKGNVESKNVVEKAGS